MRGKVAKKIRRETRKFWSEYLERVAELSFRERLSLLGMAYIVGEEGGGGCLKNCGR